MDRAVVVVIIDLLIVCPILLVYRKRDGQNSTNVLIFCAFFLINHLLLRLPQYYNPLGSCGLHWNWSGKAYALTGSVVTYLLSRKILRYNDFFTWKQKTGSLRLVSLVAAVLLIPTITGAFLLPKKPFDAETLGFQLTMPGLDEETSYRGVMLGFLLTSLSGPIRVGKYSLNHPGVWVTAILFGLVHGFQLAPDWVFRMNWGYFSQTFLTGWLLAWVTVESRSIVFPIVLHNLINFLAILIRMIT